MHAQLDREGLFRRWSALAFVDGWDRPWRRRPADIARVLVGVVLVAVLTALVHASHPLFAPHWDLPGFVTLALVTVAWLGLGPARGHRGPGRGAAPALVGTGVGGGLRAGRRPAHAVAAPGLAGQRDGPHRRHVGRGDVGVAAGPPDGAPVVRGRGHGVGGVRGRDGPGLDGRGAPGARDRLHGRLPRAGRHRHGRRRPADRGPRRGRGPGAAAGRRRRRQQRPGRRAAVHCAWPRR